MRSKKRVLAVILLLALPLALEASVRTRQRVRYGTWGRIHDFVRDPASGLDIPAPGRRTASMSIDSRGFRSPELDVPKPSGRKRIAFIGASTTFCAEASSDAATWPYLVAEGARAATGLDLDFVNAGVAGYTTVQSLINLQKRVAPLEPDVVVIYHASNDLTHETRELAIARGVYSGHADRESWLGELSLAWYLFDKNRLARERSSGSAAAAGQLVASADELCAPFRANLSELVRAARALAPEVVLVTFATQLGGAKTPEERAAAATTALYYMPYATPQDLADWFAAYAEVIREVALREGCRLVDAAVAIPPDRAHFRDSVHLVDQGCARLAELVLPEVVAALAAQSGARAGSEQGQ